MNKEELEKVETASRAKDSRATEGLACGLHPADIAELQCTMNWMRKKHGSYYLLLDNGTTADVLI